MTSGDERAQCPACEAFSPAVAAAIADGDPCPECDLPAEAFPIVAEAESRQYRRVIVDALIRYARATTRTSRALHVEQGTLADTRRELTRAAQRVDSTRAELEQVRTAQAGTRDRDRAEIEDLRDRLEQVRAAVMPVLDRPLPATRRAARS